MANSYGFTGEPPAWAMYGVYDTENGEWTGVFFSSVEAAQRAANDLSEDDTGVIANVADDQDYLEPIPVGQAIG